MKHLAGACVPSQAGYPCHRGTAAMQLAGARAGEAGRRDARARHPDGVLFCLFPWFRVSAETLLTNSKNNWRFGANFGCGNSGKSATFCRRMMHAKPPNSSTNRCRQASHRRLVHSRPPRRDDCRVNDERPAVEPCLSAGNDHEAAFACFPMESTLPG